MEEEGNYIEGKKQIRQMLYAMTEVMFQVVALGFESVVVLVFNLPP